MQPSQLDLQLAWAFRDFPVVWDRLARRGARLADAEGAWTRHLHMRNAWQTLRTLEEHAEFHGVHPRVEPDGGIVRLRWPLTLWPEYEPELFPPLSHLCTSSYCSPRLAL